MDNDKINAVTKELLDMTSYLKKCIEKSMVVGDTYVIKGIIFFEKILRTINPCEINEDVINNIKRHINDLIVEKNIPLNRYYMLGISKCYFIMYDYNMVYKTRKLK